jgi:hypothetical protein
MPCYVRTVDAKIRDKKPLISRCQRKKSQLTIVYPFCVTAGIRHFFCGVMHLKQLSLNRGKETMKYTELEQKLTSRS